MNFLQELLEEYQVRKTKAQKEAFLSWAQAQCESMGYSARAEENKGSKLCRNLVVGDVENAQVVFTAHYDTCAKMPVPNLVFPKNFLLTLLVQMPLILVMLFISIGAALLAVELTGNENVYSLVFLVLYFGFMFLILYGPANPHTANDNTSGTAALFEIMAALPENLRSKAAFIFFDNEEGGKIGSKAYAKAHKGLMDGKILLNLDCIGDGEHFLIVAPKKADERLISLLQQAFQSRDGKIALHCSAKNTHYNSDQLSFPKVGAAVAACHKNKLGYFIPRIHTTRDIICDESNLAYVCVHAIKLVEMM